MQRLQLDPEEKITRKEYLRRKRKQANGLKKRSKITSFFETFSLSSHISLFIISKTLTLLVFYDIMLI